MPFTIDPLHFIGIGGIGMSGIAEILHNLGYEITGSDLSSNSNVQRLRNLGLKIYEGHDRSHIQKAKFIVISSAVKKDNPEYCEAKKRGIPIVSRAEMLAELMRLKSAIAIAGTHGKTTTTSLVGTILAHAEFDPTVVNGGILNAYGTNAFLGKGEWIVVEADESDGTFIKLPASVGIITNIEPEHMEHYGSFKKLKATFKTFIEKLPFYGFAVVCNDHPTVREVIADIEDRRIIKYGFEIESDVRADNLIQNEDGVTFDCYLSRNLTKGPVLIPNVQLPMYGRHNVLNALSAIAVAHELGISPEKITTALKSFEGVKRRFTKVDNINNITIIDDYAHHPTEINAVLSTAKQICKNRVIAVVQPHRYSRVKDYFDDFAKACMKADHIIVTPIYAAGEQPIDGISHTTLIQKIKELGHENVEELPTPVILAPLISEKAKDGDYVICMGAGNITEWANKLPTELELIQTEAGQVNDKQSA